MNVALGLFIAVSAVVICVIVLRRRRPKAPGRCYVCGTFGPTDCLLFLGAKRFCPLCSLKILQELQ